MSYTSQIFYVTNQNWFPPAGIKDVTVEGWGPGGNGGSSGGGGGGGYAKGTVPVVHGFAHYVRVGDQSGTFTPRSGFVNAQQLISMYGLAGGDNNGAGGGASRTGAITGWTDYTGGAGASGGGGGGCAGSNGPGGNASGSTGGLGTSLYGGDGGNRDSVGIRYGGGGGGGDTSYKGTQGLVILTWLDPTPNIVNNVIIKKVG